MTSQHAIDTFQRKFLWDVEAMEPLAQYSFLDLWGMHKNGAGALRMHNDRSRFMARLEEKDDLQVETFDVEDEDPEPTLEEIEAVQLNSEESSFKYLMSKNPNDLVGYDDALKASIGDYASEAEFQKDWRPYLQKRRLREEKKRKLLEHREFHKVPISNVLTEEMVQRRGCTENRPEWMQLPKDLELKDTQFDGSNGYMKSHQDKPNDFRCAAGRNEDFKTKLTKKELNLPDISHLTLPTLSESLAAWRKNNGVAVENDANGADAGPEQQDAAEAGRDAGNATDAAMSAKKERKRVKRAARAAMTPEQRASARKEKEMRRKRWNKMDIEDAEDMEPPSSDTSKSSEKTDSDVVVVSNNNNNNNNKTVCMMFEIYM